MTTPMDVNLQGYNMVLALTQNNINANLKFLMGASDGIKPDIDVTIKTEDANLKAFINPPEVKLFVDQNAHSIIFIVGLRKGSLEYWKGHGPNSKKMRLDIKNWKLGFSVNLNIKDIETSALPVEVQKEVKNLGQGMFSARQLFMDFQNANLANWDPSTTSIPAKAKTVEVDTGGKPVPGSEMTVDLNTDPSSSAYLTLYMNEYMKQAQVKGHHILGYGISVKNPNTVDAKAPTTPPTDFNFSINPYLPQGKPGTPDIDHGLDTLNFNIMTANRKLPSNLPAWLGNFVTDRGIYGALVISRKVFIDEYLLPLLAPITNFSLDVKKHGSRGVTYTRNSHDHPFIVTSTGGTFSSHSKVVIDTTETFLKFPADITFETNTNVEVSVASGGKSVTVKGYAKFYFLAQAWAGIKHHALEEDASQTAELNWEMEILLDSVSKDGINAKVTKKVNKAKNHNGGNWLGQLEDLVNPDFSKYGTELEQTLTRIIDVTHLESAITHTLNGPSRYFFPGGRTFKMIDPVFNNELDLMVNLEYIFY